jgi:hypothetical protein
MTLSGSSLSHIARRNHHDSEVESLRIPPTESCWKYGSDMAATNAFLGRVAVLEVVLTKYVRVSLSSPSSVTYQLQHFSPLLLHQEQPQKGTHQECPRAH